MASSRTTCRTLPSHWTGRANAVRERSISNRPNNVDRP